MADTRACAKCAAEKPLTEFRRNRGMRDGYLRACKACNSAYERAYRQKNADRLTEYERRRNHTPQRLAMRAKQTKAFRNSQPMANAAHVAVSRAVKAGVLEKLPCYFCGGERVDAHHHDYNKPLDVTWLCKPCHRKFHSLERRATYDARRQEKTA